MSHESKATEAREEIEWLLATGLSWDGQRLTHPKDPAIWRCYDPVTYECTFSQKWIERMQRLDAEAEQAAQAARGLVRERRMR